MSKTMADNNNNLHLHLLHVFNHMPKRVKEAVNVEKVTNSTNNKYRLFLWNLSGTGTIQSHKVSCDADTVCGRESFCFVLWCYQSTSCEFLPLRFGAADTVPGLTVASKQGGGHTGLLETMYNRAWELLCNFLISNNVLKLKESGSQFTVHLCVSMLPQWWAEENRRPVMS